MHKVEVNIISDGNITTNNLLVQIFNSIKNVGLVSVIYINDLTVEDLLGKVNIFCRNCNPAFSWLPIFLRRKKIPYIFYIDDNLWELNDGSILARYHSSPQVKKSLNNYSSNANLIITSTVKLAEYLRNMGGGYCNNVITLPNFVDFSKFTFNKKQIRDKRKFRIGYAGSAKPEAFAPVFSALEDIRNLGWDFSVEFVGFAPETKLIIDRQFPYQDSYEKYVTLVHSRDWDLALAPFLDDYFWSFKTDNKYREYSALKIPAIYSNLEPYSCVISDGVNGLLSNNDVVSWRNKLLLVLKGSVNLARISQAAYDDVKNRYDINTVSKEWEEQLDLHSFINLSYKCSVYDNIYWSYKRNFSIQYLLLLIRLLIASLRYNGVNITLKKVIRFLRRCRA